MFYEKETKVRKAAEESGQCNMRTVTTEDNPYKGCWRYTFCVFGSGIDFRSVDLYGSSVREKRRCYMFKIFILRMKVVQEISPYIRHFQEWSWSIMICIWNIVIRCRVHVLDLLKLIVGRGGVSVRLESVVIAMAAGNLSICTLHKKSHTSTFPTSHYHGITITIELEEITDEMRRILKLLSINLTRISEFAGKQDFYMVRANETVNIYFRNYILFRNI